MIPLVSSISYGPIGVCQLPRLWWKVQLNAAGQLDADYPECSGGLDSRVIERLGLDREAVLEHLHSERPDYLSFEDWVISKTGEPDPADIDAWNEEIRERVHRPEKLKAIPQAVGLREDCGITSAVVLNHIEDWHYFHLQLGEKGPPQVPLISTIDYGPLEVCQLPRTWLKILLEAEEKLHAEYPGCGAGLDARVLDVLRLDRNETVAYLREETPSYLDFESWVLDQNRGGPDQAAVAEWNAFVRQRQHPEEKRKAIHATVGRPDDGKITSAVVLNHIEDWHLAFADLRV